MDFPSKRLSAPASPNMTEGGKAASTWMGRIHRELKLKINEYLQMIVEFCQRKGNVAPIILMYL